MTRGFFYLLSSAFVFALATLFAKIVVQTSSVPAVELTFFRFLAGFILISIVALRNKENLRPAKTSYVLLRAICNTVAVLLFFIAIEDTTVSKANMLNMTYPVFVFLLSPFINRESISTLDILYLAVAVTGIYLVMTPESSAGGFETLNRGDILALGSGLVAGFSITFLREARKYDSSTVILFYLMAIGSFLNFFIVLPVFVLPTGKTLLYVLLCTGFSVAGQIFITSGYRYIDAAAGSLVSSSRILFALMLGIIILGEDLTWTIGGGGFLIILALFGVSGVWKKAVK